MQFDLHRSCREVQQGSLTGTTKDSITFTYRLVENTVVPASEPNLILSEAWNSWWQTDPYYRL